MISKRIHCKAENDSYKRLANYIADAKNKGEKCLHTWTAGTWAEDDYNLAIIEAEDTQSLNQRTSKEKTYHLIISFTPEDENKLSSEDYQDIEKRFAEVLGLSEHQRHCGVHSNTDNTHMHIAYNLIHKDKLTRFEPFRDYKARDILCRQLEREYGLTIDNGRGTNDKGISLSDSSGTFEARTGIKSFEKYVLNRKEILLEALTKAQSWEDLHKSFQFYGIEIKPRGAGLVIKNMCGKQSMKASSLDRQFSLKNLTDLFGEYTASKESSITHEKYAKDPLQNAKSSPLWKEFVELTNKDKLDAINEKYYLEELKLINTPLKRAVRNDRQKLLRLEKRQDIKAAKNKDIKYKDWNSFLQSKAEQGDNNALQLLQSKQNTDMEQIIKKYSNPLEAYQENILHERAEILNNTNLDKKTKKHLLEINNMNKLNINYTFKVSRNGSIIFTLENGEKIIDNGKQIAFTENAKSTALNYAKMKFGKNIGINNENKIVRLAQEIKEPQRGLER